MSSVLSFLAFLKKCIKICTNKYSLKLKKKLFIAYKV